MALFGGNDQELRVTIRAKDEATKDLNKVQTSLGKLAGGFALGTAAVEGLRAGFRFLSGTLTDSIREFEEQQLAVAQLNAVLKSTNYAAGVTAKQLVEMADSLSKTTLYADDMVLSAENMLLTFTNITRDVFPDTIKTVLDMSTALGQDLKASAIQLGKALNNPIEGVSALQRVGVSFSNAQQEMIETMVKSGRTMEAQRFILAELQKEFGGSAESAFQAASSITKLQKNVQELKEDIGSGLVPAMNNLFAATQAVTSGMGKTVDVGRATFRTFAAIGEFAANTAAGVRYLAGEMVKFSARQLQWTLGPLNAIKSVREGFDNFTESVDEGRDVFVDFALDLKNRNNAVLDSWGDVTAEARAFGQVGPAAYEATAQEAEAARKKMEETKRTIADTRRDLEGIQKALMSGEEAAARAFADQELKVSDLRKQATLETDPQRKAEIMTEIAKESAALEKARPMFSGEMGGVLESARKRSLMTDFEREIQDIRGRALETVGTANQIIINLDAKGSVMGDAGVQEMLRKLVNELNRQSALLRAGA